jgi:hypothetical protein
MASDSACGADFMKSRLGIVVEHAASMAIHSCTALATNSGPCRPDVRRPRHSDVGSPATRSRERADALWCQGSIDRPQDLALRLMAASRLTALC